VYCFRLKRREKQFRGAGVLITVVNIGVSKLRDLSNFLLLRQCCGVVHLLVLVNESGMLGDAGMEARW
jgi:hypothetical protein